MIALAEIQRNRLIQRQLCLECSPSYLSAPDSAIQEEYNGGGLSNRLGLRLRQVATP